MRQIGRREWRELIATQPSITPGENGHHLAGRGRIEWETESLSRGRLCQRVLLATPSLAGRLQNAQPPSPRRGLVGQRAEANCRPATIVAFRPTPHLRKTEIDVNGFFRTSQLLQTIAAPVIDLRRAGGGRETLDIKLERPETIQVGKRPNIVLAGKIDPHLAKETGHLKKGLIHTNAETPGPFPGGGVLTGGAVGVDRVEVCIADETTLGILAKKDFVLFNGASGLRQPLCAVTQVIEALFSLTRLRKFGRDPAVPFTRGAKIVFQIISTTDLEKRLRSGGRRRKVAEQGQPVAPCLIETAVELVEPCTLQPRGLRQDRLRSNGQVRAAFRPEPIKSTGRPEGDLVRSRTFEDGQECFAGILLPAGPRLGLGNADQSVTAGTSKTSQYVKRRLVSPLREQSVTESRHERFTIDELRLAGQQPVEEPLLIGRLPGLPGQRRRPSQGMTGEQ